MLNEQGIVVRSIETPVLVEEDVFGEKDPEEFNFERVFGDRKSGDSIFTKVPVNLIVRNPYQPRTLFRKEDLKEMAKSIEYKGDVIEPIGLVPRKNRLMLKRGERRWRASKLAGIEKISAVIYFRVSDDDMLEDNIISDLYHKRLNIFELAIAIKRLMDNKNLTQAEVGRRFGKKSSEIANILRVFRLHNDVQQKMFDGDLPNGVGLQFALFPIDKQIPLLKIYEQKVIDEFNGKHFHPNLAAKFLRKEAEGMKIQALKSKRGKNPLTHAEMALQGINRKVRNLGKDIQELSQIQEKRLKSAKKPSALNTLSLLEQLREQLGDEIENMKTKLEA